MSLSEILRGREFEGVALIRGFPATLAILITEILVSLLVPFSLSRLFVFIPDFP